MESIQALCTLGNAELLATKCYKFACLTIDLQETTPSPPLQWTVFHLKSYEKSPWAYNYGMLQPGWYLAGLTDPELLLTSASRLP